MRSSASFLRSIQILSNELDWIHSEILKIQEKNRDAPDDRCFYSSEDIARLRFLLSRNEIVGLRLSQARKRIASSSPIHCER